MLNMRIVAKVGGKSSIKRNSINRSELVNNIPNLLNHVKKRYEKGHELVLVTSAICDSTNLLEAVYKKKSENEDCSKEAKSFLDLQYEALRLNNLDTSLIINEVAEFNKTLCNSYSNKDELYAAIVSFGEIIGTKIIGSAIQQISKIPVRILSSHDIGFKTTGSYRNAQYVEGIEDEVRKNIVIDGKINVVTGWTGKSDDGKIAVLGRGGSDVTGTYIARIINANRMEFLKDEDLSSTDPKIVPEAKRIDEVSYLEMEEAARLGAKVLHPNAVRHLKEKNIEGVFLNVYDNSYKGSRLIRNANGKYIVKIITIKENQDIFTVVNEDMSDTPGYLERIALAYAKNGLSIDMIGSSNISVSCTANKMDDNKFEQVYRELSGIGYVYPLRGKSLIAAVGEGMKNKPGTLARLSSALGDNNIDIEMTSQTPQQIYVGFVVDNDYGKEGLRAIHKEFFNYRGPVKKAMRHLSEKLRVYSR